MVGITSKKINWILVSINLNVRSSDLRSSVFSCRSMQNSNDFAGFVNIFNSTFKQLTVSEEFTVELRNCAFEGLVMGNGPLIEIKKSILRIMKCRFSFNDGIVTKAVNNSNYVSSLHTIGQGSLLHVLDNSKLEIVNSMFQNQSLSGVNQSVISIEQSSSAVMLNTTFLGNTVVRGSILQAITNSSLAVSNCLFIKNMAMLGGAIYVDSSISFEEAETKENIPILFVKNCSFTGNIGRDSGAIYVRNNMLSEVSNCKFHQNHASLETMSKRVIATKGGAILLISNFNTSVKNSVFIKNSATSGGALCLYQGRITITGSLFSRNIATESGGVIFSENSTINVFTSDFYRNSANRSGVMDLYHSKSIQIQDSTFTANYGLLSGLLQFNYSQNIFIFNSKFKNNYDINSTKIMFNALMCSRHHRNLQIENSEFTNHMGTHFYVLKSVNSNSTMLRGCRINLNHFHKDGDLLYFSSERNVYVDDCQIFDNIGRLIYNMDSQIVIRNTAFIANSYSHNAFYFKSVSRNSFVKFVDCSFERNSLGDTFDFQGVRHVMFKECKFINNVVTNGGLIVTEGEISIVNSIFINNTVSHGIILTGTEAAESQNCTFLNNTATGLSLITTSASFTLMKTSFVNNTARLGILSATNTLVKDTSFLKVSWFRGEIKGNTITHGSLMEFSRITVKFNDLQLVFNKVAYGLDLLNVHFLTSGYMEIIKCSFQENVFTNLGLVVENAVDLYIQDSYFYQPFAREIIGLINFSAVKSIRIANSTFYSFNTAVVGHVTFPYKFLTWQTQFYYKNISLKTNQKNFVNKAFSLGILERRSHQAGRENIVETPFAASKC